MISVRASFSFWSFSANSILIILSSVKLILKSNTLFHLHDQ
jgi:hypothetical protein